VVKHRWNRHGKGRSLKVLKSPQIPKIAATLLLDFQPLKIEKIFIHVIISDQARVV